MKTIDFKNASVDTLNAWRIVYGLVGDVPVVPLNVSRSTVGSEFLTYAANKYYFALDMILFADGSLPINSTTNIQPYTIANALMGVFNSNIPYWDVTATAYYYYGRNLRLKNFHFSRFTVNRFNHIYFNGYRITW